MTTRKRSRASAPSPHSSHPQSRLRELGLRAIRRSQGGAPPRRQPGPGGGGRLTLLPGGAGLLLLTLLGACRSQPDPHASSEGVTAIRARVAQRGVVTRATTTLTALPPLDFEAPELGLSTGKLDAAGKPVRVACRTCHERVVPPSRDAYRRRAAVFHKAIRLRHGAKTCQTCHRPPRFDDFNLADGTPVPPGEVMRLCGQCHASRLEEYLHGAHGGMTGYWDLKRGPRQRNHCLGCHDPHHPRIQPVQPAPMPRN